MNSTGNELESNDILDFSDNCENFDILLNADQDYWTTRLGEKKPTVDYALRMAGFTPAGFDFTTGGILGNGDRNKCVFNQADQTWYSWSGNLPYNVIGGSVPGEGWKVVERNAVTVAREALRRTYQEVGLNLVSGSFEQGGVLNNQNDVLLYEATGVAYAYSGTLPRTIGVGETLIGNPLWVDQSLSIFGRNIKDVVHAIGKSAKSIPPDYNLPLINQFTYTNGSFAAGNALGKATAAGQTIAIGPEAMGNTLRSFENIAIGEVALQNVQSDADDYAEATTGGTRNVAIGGNASQFLTKAQGTVAIGRNAAVCNVLASGMVAIGNGALGGYAVSGWDASITNFMPNNNAGTQSLVAVGYAAGAVYQGTNIVAVGRGAANNAKFSTGLTCLGTSAGLNIEESAGFNGKVKTVADGSNQSYTQAGNTVTVVCPGHTATVGGYAGLRLVTGGAAYPHFHEFPVQVTAIVDANTYQVTSPYSLTASGQARTYWFTSLANATRVNNMELIGNQAGAGIVSGQQSVVIGTAAAQFTPLADSAVLIGFNSGNAIAASITASVGVGSGAFQTATGINNATAVGHQAGMLMQNGATPNVLTNVSCFGYRAYVSGDNQVQLGNSATTTYVYGTVQNRSDERDKADISPTQLGDAFIDGLEAEEGHWDMRDDYQEEYEEEVGVDEEGNPIFETRVRQLPKDGSKKRNRKHQWFVAQKVKALCDELGVDFGGFQDHSVNGGCDVLSLGYDEFIPPLTAYVQRRKKEIETLTSIVNQQELIIKDLKVRIEKLESK